MSATDPAGTVADEAYVAGYRDGRAKAEVAPHDTRCACPSDVCEAAGSPGCYFGEVVADGPAGLTISEDGVLLNWRGVNYVRQRPGVVVAESVIPARDAEPCARNLDG